MLPGIQEEGAGVCSSSDPPCSSNRRTSCEGSEEVGHRRGESPVCAPEGQQRACRDATDAPQRRDADLICRRPTRIPMKGESWLLEKGQTSLSVLERDLP